MKTAVVGVSGSQRVSCGAVCDLLGSSSACTERRWHGNEAFEVIPSQTSRHVYIVCVAILKELPTKCVWWIIRCRLLSPDRL